MTCQYISHCMSNLTDILLVDYLVVVWACFFWQRVCCRFFPDMKTISLPIFLNSRFLFGLMFRIHNNFFRFSWLFLLFFLLLYFIIKFFKSCLVWPFSTNTSIENFYSSFICFSEHIECALWRKPLKALLIVLGWSAILGWYVCW